MDAPRDKNHIPALLGQDSTDPTKVLPIRINPVTGRVLIETLWTVPLITSIVTTGGTRTLTTSENSSIALEVSGVLTSNAIIIVANSMAQFVVDNTTTGAFTLTIKTLAGLGVIVAQGTHVILYANGVDVELAEFGAAGSGDMVLASAQTNSGVKTFLNGTFGLRNIANTITSFFSSTATVSRTYTLQDRDGVLADNTDLAGKQNSLGFTPENVANKDATGGYAGLTLFKINFKNAANTFTNFLTNATTASRTYTFQDRDGTIADNTDLALKAPLASPTFTGTVAGITAAMVGAPSGSGTSSGSNTGDQTNISGNAATSTTAPTTAVLVSQASPQSIGATGSRMTKVWSTDIESTNIPTVGGTAILSSLTAPQFTTVELWHASDTTLSRLSAGVLGVEWVAVPTVSSTSTIIGKRNQPRIVSAASYTTDTGTSLDFSTCDIFIVTAQAGALKFNNPSGTPQHGEKMIIRVKDNWTACALTYDTQYRAVWVTLPSTTIISKTLYLWGIWNTTDTKIDIVAVSQEA